MRTKVFAVRTAKEILRDPLNLFFCFIFPLILLLLLSAIQQKIPGDVFKIESLVPGIAIFGLSFMSLFSATLLAKDRSSSLLTRLYTSPMTATNFIAGYCLPLVPIALIQSGLCYLAGIFLGMKLTIGVFFSYLLVIPSSIVFIGIGLLCGGVLNEKQVGGVCGALLTNLTAWFSGAWFNPNMVGGVFKRIADGLPFSHGVEMGRVSISRNYDLIKPHLMVVLIYGILLMLLAVILFRRDMRRD